MKNKNKKYKTKQKIKKSKSFFAGNYRKSWNYIKESRNFIYAIIGVFVLFILFGALFPVPEILEQRILNIIGELLRKTQGMSISELIGFIFFNNLESSFLGLFLGFFLGVFPLITGIVNGYILGFVMLKSVEVSGALVLWRLLPHGIFELPALFISLGLGLKLGSFIIKEKKMETLKNYLFESARVFVFVIIPLLIIAAAIEGSLIFFLVK